MAIETDIMAALFARLSALTLSPALPVSWPNIAFAPPADGKYLRANYLPNTTNRPLIDSEGPYQHQGIFQITVAWPVNVGETAPLAVASQVADWFDADRRLVSGGAEVRIVGRPSIAPSQIDGNNVLIPISVGFECWA